jgi:hypothetical protein
MPDEPVELPEGIATSCPAPGRGPRLGMDDRRVTTCQGCGQPFETASKSRRYCSVACRPKAPRVHSLHEDGSPPRAARDELLDALDHIERLRHRLRQAVARGRNIKYWEARIKSAQRARDAVLAPRQD